MYQLLIANFGLVFRKSLVLIMLGVFISCMPINSNAKSNSPKIESILILGDSLSAEYGLLKNTGWVTLLSDQLKKTDPNVKVINSSISGETTAGGLNRLNTLVNQYKPNLLIIELGANDALRGLELETTKLNIKKMIEIAQKNNCQVLLLGMQIPTNYGKKYSQDFQRLYADIAKAEKVYLVPFLLEKVALDPSLFQTDRIHPNEKAQQTMMQNVWAVLKNIL